MSRLLNEIKRINVFIRQPKEFFSEDLSVKEKTVIFLCVFLYNLFVTAFILLTLYLLNEHILALRMPLLKMSLPSIVFFMIFLIPLFEELIFRLPLRRKRNWIWRLLEEWFRMEPKVLWNRCYRYILYFFVIVFGLLHLSNYKNKEILFFVLAPLIVAPQLFVGLLLSYIRLRLGFWWGVLKHCTWNGLIIFGSILFFHDKEVIHTQQSNLALSVSELMYIENWNGKFDVFQTEDGLIDSISIRGGSLQQLLDSLYTEDHFLVFDDTWIELQLHAKPAIKKEILLDLLKAQYQIKPIAGN